MTEVFALALPDEEIFADKESALLGALEPSRRPEVLRYGHRKVYQRKVLGRLLLQWAVATRYKLPVDHLTVSKYQNEKPYFNQHPEIHFNVSHSGRWIVTALSDAPVGVDVEKVRNANLAVARRFFATEEYLQLTTKNEESQRSFFFDLWTLKESYLKALGTGLTRPLNTFVVRHEKHHFRLYANNVLIQGNLLQLPLEDDYKLAVCSFEDTRMVSLQTIELETILKV
ncbi:MAG: 4'-phosphopantetheinyl transferase superfamily protein [Clostridia bacterium]|nr:4'-phosphopantetheinyl transferase superfamily protein [Clostridia bacterium]